MRQVIQCLIDWLNKEVSDEKPHRILRALAYESLKKADFDDHKRRFTADELVAAADEILKPTDAKKWIDWPGSFTDYWQTREPQIIEFARQQGLQVYPKPVRLSTRGGPGNVTTFFIKAMPLPEISPKEQAFQAQQDKDTGQHQAHYEISSHDEIETAWIAKWLFKNGQLHLRSWPVWVIIGWLLLIGGSISAVSYVGWISSSIPHPVTTRELTLLLSLFGIPYLIWTVVIRPWIRLFDDRIVLAHDLLINFKEKPAQFELLKDGELRLIRLVRYSAACPLCGATLYLEEGAPDYPRRLVGRCHESPREHVFSFDRVTRKGKSLRNNDHNNRT